MAKYYLDSDGVRVLVRSFNDGLDTKADKSDLSNFATKEDLNNVSVDLTGYATESYVDAAVQDLEPYDDSEIRSKIEELEGAQGGLYHFKGSVADLEALMAIENPEVGDTYNIADTGMNAAWTGEAWDEFGSVADLTDYLKHEDIQPISRSELDEILYGGKKAAVFDTQGFAAMVNNSEPEVTITLNEDIALEETMVIPANKTVTLKLGDKKLAVADKSLQVDGNVTFEDGTIEGSNRSVIVAHGGALTIDGTKITSSKDCAVSVTGSGSSVTVEAGEITAQEVPVIVTNGASAVINGGHLKGLDNFAIGGNGTKGQVANVTINGGVIEGNIQSSGYTAAAIYWPNAGTLNINGGTIISTGAGVVQRGGTVNLNSGTVITANGPAGFVGKVGDSRVVVGSYGVVFDKSANYPDVDNMQLNIASDVVISGTDGDIQVLPGDATGIND